MSIIEVCTGKNCQDRYASYILKRLNADKEKFDANNLISVTECACQWNCQQWPLVMVDHQKMDYQNPIKASEAFMRKLSEHRRNSKCQAESNK